MKQSKKIRRVAAVLAAVAVLCSSTTSLRCADAAVSEGDLDALQQEQQELEQQREKLEQQQEATKAKLDQLRADKSKQQEYKATLDSQMQNVQSQINVLNQQVSTLDTSIQEKTAQLSGKQQEVNTTFDELKKRLCAIYKTGEASTLQILLRSQNVMDLANNCLLYTSGKWNATADSGNAKGYSCVASNNDERVAFLAQFGWQVEAEPLEIRDVAIPDPFDEVYLCLLYTSRCV